MNNRSSLFVFAISLCFSSLTKSSDIETIETSITTYETHESSGDSLLLPDSIEVTEVTCSNDDLPELTDQEEQELERLLNEFLKNNIEQDDSSINNQK